MQTGITKQGDRQKPYADIVKFMKEGMFSMGFQETLHEQHVENNAQRLQDEIKIAFKKKTGAADAVVIYGFGEQHAAEEKSIAGIIQELPVATLEIIGEWKQDHHQQQAGKNISKKIILVVAGPHVRYKGAQVLRMYEPWFDGNDMCFYKMKFSYYS